MKQNNSRAYILVIISMLIYGTGGIFRKSIPLSSEMVCLIRGTLGCLFIFAYVKLRGRRLRNGIPRRDVLLLILSGVFIGVNWILLFEAYNYTTVSTATLCYYMQPTILMVISPLLFRERLTNTKLLCALLAFIGMMLVSGFPGAFSMDSANMKGVFLALSAALFYTVVIIVNKFIGDWDTCERTFLQIGTAALIMVPYILFTGTYAGLPGLFSDSRGLVMMIVMGLVNTGIAYVLYFSGLPKLRAQSAAVLSYIDPVSALFWAALLLRESMTLKMGIGAVLIIGSALFCELTPEKAGQ